MKVKYLNEGKINLIEVTYSMSHLNIPNNGEYIQYKGEMYEVGLKTTDLDKQEIRIRASCNYL